MWVTTLTRSQRSSMSYVTHVRHALSARSPIEMVQLVLESGWAHARVSKRYQVTRGTVSKWVTRFRAGGTDAMNDHTSKPATTPNRTGLKTEHRIVYLRVARSWGPHRIRYHLRLPQSTVSKVLKRYRVPVLGLVDRNTGVRVRVPRPIRYKYEHPGD